MRERRARIGVALALVVATAALVSAQRAGAADTAPPPPSPQAAAPIDLTGYWVSIVNEDWRWRMVTPPKGDYASLPLNAEGRKVADTWEPSQDGSCLAYGAAGLMRMPTRLRVTWEDEQTLNIETDAGRQTRRLLFDQAAARPTTSSLQGFSLAEWERPTVGRRGGGPGSAAAGPGGAPGPIGGSLKVVTTQLSGGWLRKNGVPYSDTTTVTEYFDRFPVGDDQWLVVTTLVSDPMYLTQEFITSSHFRREPDGSKWDPTPCQPS